MICAECNKEHYGDDYLCWTCRNPSDAEQMKGYRPPIYLGDLKGPEGNAWAIMGACQQAWRDAQKDGEIDPDLKFESIQKEMMSGSYEQLLDTVEKYFTPFVAQPAAMRAMRALREAPE